MPATPAATKQKKAGAPASPDATREPVQTTQEDSNKVVRLHITPFTPALLKAYLAPSAQAVAKNISYHTVETFPEKGFGFVELPAMEAQKLKKKLNGSTLKGSKVRIEEAKPEKRKAGDDAQGDGEDETKRAAKRVKKDKKGKKKEQGVLEGVELPDERKVKRGWTEVPVKGKKERKEKKDKEKDKDSKMKRKESKYTKEPEVLFKAKLTPVAATEVARREKKDKKKDKKKSKSKQEVVVHEFEKNTKTPSFLKTAKVSTEKKPAVDYIDGKGWVDEDGNVVETETGKAKNKRVLELVDSVPGQPVKKHASARPSPKSSPAPKSAKKGKKSKKATPPPSSSESESDSDESSVVSSSSEDDASSSDSGDASASPSPTSIAKARTPEIALTPSSPTNTKKEIHPFEALFKKPSSTSTPAKTLAPINTSFSFFGDGDVDMDNAQGSEGDAGVPITPYTQRDLEWRGLRSAAPTPDTAAIGRRFSFPWRNGSQEANDEDEDGDIEVDQQLTSNTKANASSAHLPGVAEEDENEDEEDVITGVEQTGENADEEEEKPESEFKKWFWENQGNLGRAWKKRRREAMKAKRSTENKRAVGGRRAV
ncbi:hypothetical protein N0V90_000460 [Kalmusia sp. IMI 367209]|nr:hypothetical protein N0V90_000460 [Kalmusia sp. IMI 367209]